jgi:hypothetical protein
VAIMNRLIIAYAIPLGLCALSFGVAAGAGWTLQGDEPPGAAAMRRIIREELAAGQCGNGANAPASPGGHSPPLRHLADADTHNDAIRILGEDQPHM